MSKLTSIIVPVYNVQSDLPRCMESLLAQTRQNVEIILVDDGSTDKSGELCRRYAQEHPQVQMVSKANGGLSSARNAGLEIASGEYVCFVDPDDYVDPELVKKACAALEKGGYDMCVYRTRHTYGDVVEMIPNLPYETAYTWETQEAQLKFLAGVFFSYKIAWGVCGRMFRRAHIEAAGLRFVSEREVFAEDLLFTYSYLLGAKSVVCIPDCLYHYVARSDSLMNSTGQETVIPKYHKLMKLALAYTEQSGKALIAQAFGALYAILLGSYAKNLWLHQRRFSLREVRAQFLAAEDTAFRERQIQYALCHPELVCGSQGAARGRVLLAHMRYVKTGGLIRFYAEVIFWEVYLALGKLLHRTDEAQS